MQTAGLGTVPAPTPHFLPAAVAAQVRAHDLRRGTRIGPPAEPQGMALGDCVGALATPGERPPSPTPSHRRQCVHRPVGRWTARGSCRCPMVHRLAGTGWARPQNPRAWPWETLWGRWRGRGKGRQAPHRPTDASASTARSGAGRPGDHAGARWCTGWREPDGPARRTPGHGPGRLCGGRWRLRGKGRQAPHRPTDAGASTALSGAGRSGIMPAPAGAA